MELNEGVLQLSVALGFVQVAFTQDVDVAVKEILVGQLVMTGGVLSVSQTDRWLMVTVKAQTLVFPLASVAV